MNNRKNSVKHNNKKGKNIKWYYYIPLLIIVAIVPLMVRGKHIVLNSTQALFSNGINHYMDLHSYWKSIWLVSMGILSTITYFGLLIDKKIIFKSDKHYKYYIPIAIYALLVVISSISSNYPDVVYSGFIESYQGMYVLLTYAMLTILVINYINNENDLKLISKAFILLIVMEGILGVAQYFGTDFMKSKIAMTFIMPKEFNIDGISDIFGKYTIYGTLYNSNYVGSFAALVVPLSIAFYINSTTKKAKTISAISIFLSACLWVGCNSRAGYIGLISAGLISMILLRNQIIMNYKFALSLIVGLLFIVISFNIASKGRILGQISRLNLYEEIESIEKVNTSDINVIFKDIILEKNKFIIVTNLDTLSVKLDNKKLVFLDENQKEISGSYDENNNITLKDERYKNYKIRPGSSGKGVIVNAYGRDIEFHFTEGGAKVLGCGNRLVEPFVAKQFGPLASYDSFLSNRGYIWSRSIMMLPKVIFKGHGPDTYTVQFPQDDFIAKLNIGWRATIVIDKPHNMYLQIAVNTGIISLIALLILWGIYLVSSIKIYKVMTYDSIEKSIGFACFIAVFAYLVAGIFNDQIVSVAPLFWIVLGMGISINEKLKKEKSY